MFISCGILNHVSPSCLSISRLVGAEFVAKRLGYKLGLTLTLV